MARFRVEPDRLAQFGDGSPAFLLVTDAGREPDVELAESQRYDSCAVLGLARQETLGSLLAGGRIPQAADVLVVCPDRFLASPSEELLGARRLAVLPCGSTPTTDDHVAYFLDVLRRSDVARQEKFCAQLADALDATPVLRLADPAHDSLATFEVSADYEWNQQAGVIEPGDQQIAPPGEFSALPMDVDSFDASRRLGLNGTLTASGPAIVHRAGRDGLLPEQARLFAALDTTRDAPLRLTVADGLITAWEAIDPAAEPAAGALRELFDRDAAYRIVWEFGIGCNEAIEPQPGNCGMNEMYGSENGVLHLGLGLTPTTDFAITLSCHQTTGVDDVGRQVFGAARRRRMTRTRSAGCGCLG